MGNRTVVVVVVVVETETPVLKRWTELSESKLIITKQKVPHDGVLSSLLFNFYISKLSLPPDRISATSYDNDCSVVIPGVKIDQIC